MNMSDLRFEDGWIIRDDGRYITPKECVDEYNAIHAKLRRAVEAIRAMIPTPEDGVGIAVNLSAINALRAVLAENTDILEETR